jgi:hypothetical protein
MARDPKRTRKLTTAQGHLLKASEHLRGIDLRRCGKEQRELVRNARLSIKDASTSVDEALQAEIPKAPVLDG